MEIRRESADLGPCQREAFQLYILPHSLPSLLFGISIAAKSCRIAIQLRQAGLEQHHGTPGYAESWQLEATPLAMCSAINRLIIERSKGGFGTFRIITKTLFSFDVGHAVDRGWGADWGQEKGGTRDGHKLEFSPSARSPQPVG